MAGRVLVEQRVVEDGVERADAALAIDECELAEACAALVLRDERAHDLGLGLGPGLELDRAPALEANRQPFDDPSLRVERLRRPHDALDPLGIR